MKNYKGIEELLKTSEALIATIPFPDNVLIANRYNDIYQKVIISLHHQLRNLEQEKDLASRSHKRKLRKQIASLHRSLENLR